MGGRSIAVSRSSYGMRWADRTAGGRVPDDVLDDVLEILARGLAPKDPA
jgi:hypothetical protein